MEPGLSSRLSRSDWSRDRLATTFEYLKEYGWVDENVSYEGTYTNEFAQVAADTLGMTDPEAK